MAGPDDKVEVARARLAKADVKALIEADPLLRVTPFMAALAKAGLLEEVGALPALRAAPGHAIALEGEASRSLFLVLAGEVRLRAGRGPEALEIGAAGRGEFFGEAEALRGGARRHSAIAGRTGAAIAEVPEALLTARVAKSFDVRRLLEDVLRAREQANRELDDFLGRW